MRGKINSELKKKEEILACDVVLLGPPFVKPNLRTACCMGLCVVAFKMQPALPVALRMGCLAMFNIHVSAPQTARAAAHVFRLPPLATRSSPVCRKESTFIAVCFGVNTRTSATSAWPTMLLLSLLLLMSLLPRPQLLWKVPNGSAKQKRKRGIYLWSRKI